MTDRAGPLSPPLTAGKLSGYFWHRDRSESRAKQHRRAPMNVLSSTRFVALAFVALLGSTAFQCPGQVPIKILAPAEGQLSLPGDVPVEIKFPRSVRPGSFQAELDGADEAQSAESESSDGSEAEACSSICSGCAIRAW